MTQPSYAILPERGVLAVSGRDRATFLQGIVSNDVETVAGGRAVHTGFLTPQGKYLHDFFIVPAGEEEDAPWLLDVEAGRQDDLMKRLKVYKLRSKVKLGDRRGDWCVAAVWGPGAGDSLELPQESGAVQRLGDDAVAFRDPRLGELGARILLPADGAARRLDALGLAPADAGAYDNHRLALGVPEGSRDAQVEKSTLLELGFDELGSISWTKGCYMGQELTARTKHRGLLKRRLFPVTITGAAPEPGTPVKAGQRTVGDLRSHNGQHGIALLRMDVARDAEAELSCGEARLAVRQAAWEPAAAE